MVIELMVKIVEVLLKDACSACMKAKSHANDVACRISIFSVLELGSKLQKV
jgi:hypothetical protein